MNDKNYFVQSMLHRLLYIFPIFRAICEYYTSRHPSFLLQLFHIFVRTQALLTNCVTHRCKLVVIERSQVGGRIFQLSAFNVSRTDLAVCDAALS